MEPKSKRHKISKDLLDEFQNGITENARNWITQGQHGLLMRSHVEVYPRMVVTKFYEEPLLELAEYQRNPTFSKAAEKKIKGTELSLDNFFEGFGSRPAENPTLHVTVTGPAGSGKTTTLQRFTSKKLKAGSDGGPGPFVHVLHCRNLTEKDKPDLKTFLFGQMTSDVSDEAIDQGYQLMIDSPSRVFLILDSLDTLQFKPTEKQGKFKPGEKPSAGNILHDLLTGKLLGGCNILTSSREHAIVNYTGKLQAGRVIALTGLTQESIKTLANEFLGHKDGKKALSFLESECPDVLALCSTPVFLGFTLLGWHNRKRAVPKTMSGVLVSVLVDLLHSEFSRAEEPRISEEKSEVRSEAFKKEVINKLMSLSFRGINEVTVDFSKNDLDKVGLKPEHATDLTITYPVATKRTKQSVLEEANYKLTFCHQSIQEALAALHVIKMDLLTFTKFISDNLHLPHWSVVRRVICGVLLDPDVFESACNLTTDSIQDVEEKRENLKECLAAALNEDFMLEADRLELYVALHEAGENVFDLIAECVHEIYFPGIHLVAYDLRALRSVIIHCQRLSELNLLNNQLESDVFRDLVEIIESSTAEINTLNVVGNPKAGVGRLGKIIDQCKVKTIYLTDCNLQHDDIKLLYKSLSAQTMVDRISVIRNAELGKRGMKVLGKMVHQCQVSHLSMSRCCVNDESMEAFYKSLKQSQLSSDCF